MHYYPTKKEEEIIELVYRFRFINRTQIQIILKHKDARRINSWLKELTDLNYLGRIYSHKLLENTKPAIYFLSGQGIQYIRQKHKFEVKDIKKFYDDKKATQKFIDHCINVSQFIVIMTQIERELDINDYSFFTKTECYTNKLLSKLKPDLYFTNTKKSKANNNCKNKKNRNKTNYYFLDILDPHVPRFALRYKVKQYIEFYQWELTKPPYPLVLLVLPDEQKLKHVLRFIKEQEYEYDSSKLTFQLTTIDKLLNFKNERDIWRGVENDSN